MSTLTLDEAIKHCLEVAGEQQMRADIEEMIGVLDRWDVESCKECAADHRQLAEWLMELKDLRAEQNDQYVFIHELMSELKEAKRLLNQISNMMNIVLSKRIVSDVTSVL